ncbi:MAG TPA: MASE1 domain-containing protein [Verrucomicrobiae bacterium]|nr:MASE1 domain-containing protein [Verrucomicrobiae bacterium]
MQTAQQPATRVPLDWGPHWARVLVVGVIYCVAAILGLLLAVGKTNASAVWPPSGIALGAVLLLGRRAWPGILAGAFVANVVVFLAREAAGPPVVLAVSACIAAGNTLEALAAGALLRRWVGTANPLEGAWNLLKFVAAVLTACGISSLVGPTCVALARIMPWDLYPTVWSTWWLGDATGMLVLVPLLLAWRNPPGPRSELDRWQELTLLAAVLAITNLMSFGGWLLPRDTHYPLTYLPFPVLLWAAFRFGPRVTSSAILVVAASAVWGTLQGNGPFVRGTINESLLSLEAFIGVTAVTILATCAVVSERRVMVREIRGLNSELEGRVSERTAQLAEANERLHTLSRRLLVAQEGERKRIARELHDEIGQSITAAQLNLRSLQRRAGGEGLAPQLEENVLMLEQVLEQVRDLSLDLRPSMLDDLGLVAALRWYTIQQAQRAGLRPVFRAGPLEGRLDPALETTCFRLAQEAVTNVIRHAQAGRLTVELHREKEELHLLVRDDGVGFDLAVVRRAGGARASLGLLGMVERASLVAGRLEIRAAPQHGTEVHAWLPLHCPADDAKAQVV